MIRRTLVAAAVLAAGLVTGGQAFALDNNVSIASDGNACTSSTTYPTPRRLCWIEPWHCTPDPLDRIGTVSPILRLCQFH